MSQLNPLSLHSTPVYVQVQLEDGRVMILPAETIQQPLQQSIQQVTGQTLPIQQAVNNLQSQQQPQQQPQPQSQQTSSLVSRMQGILPSQDRSRNYHTARSQPSQLDHTSSQIQMLSGQCSNNNNNVSNNNVSNNNVSNNNVPNVNASNIDITNLVQTISIENTAGSPTTEGLTTQSLVTQDTCMMKCGSDGSSKGSERLVTDSRCGHVICVSCLMKCPNACPLCRRDHVLDRHIVVSYKKETYGCKICQKTFKRSGDLIRHERVCHGVNTGSYSCNVCKKNFVRAFDLKRHLATHNSEKKFECDLCNAKFNRCENLKRHKMVHSGIKPYHCGYCDKDFGQQENLKRHLLIHTGEYQKYRCTQCKKEFTRLASLRRHEHKHTGVWPYTCTVCNRGFSEPGLFEKHKLVHQGIKPYTCSVCGKGFNNPKAWRNHRRIHTGERPYVCNICAQTFNQWGHLKRHKQIHQRDNLNPGTAGSSGGGDSLQIPKLCFISKRKPHTRKREQDPKKPKAPLTAYFMWFMDAREQILQNNPTLKMPDLAKAGGKLWKTICDDEKRYYERKASLERAKYKERLEKYHSGCRATNEETSTNDRCVGTDAEQDKPLSLAIDLQSQITINQKIENSEENKTPLQDFTETQPNFTAPDSAGTVTDEADLNRSLLESAGRSIGILPESFQDNELLDHTETAFPLYRPNRTSTTTTVSDYPSSNSGYSVTTTTSYQVPNSTFQQPTTADSSGSTFPKQIVFSTQPATSFTSSSTSLNSFSNTFSFTNSSTNSIQILDFSSRDDSEQSRSSTTSIP